MQSCCQHGKGLVAERYRHHAGELAGQRACQLIAHRSRVLCTLLLANCRFGQ